MKFIFLLLTIVSVNVCLYPMKQSHAHNMQSWESGYEGQDVVTMNDDKKDVKERGNADRTIVIQEDVVYDYSQELVKAVEVGNESNVKKLLQARANPNAKDSKGISCLCIAVNKGYKDIVDMIIAQGADVNARDNEGWTALAYAIYEGHKEVVKLLLDKGADPTITYYTTIIYSLKGVTDITPLMLATALGHKDIVEMLLGQGADVNTQDSIGRTALIRAIDKGHKEVVKLLLDKGANPAINCRGLQGVIGITPLMLAADLGHKDIVEILIAYEAVINAQDEWGCTALVHAIRREDKEVVRMLLNNGADPTITYTTITYNIQNITGNTPLMLAAALGHKEIIEMLLAQGADINAQNSIGRTALIRAIDREDKEVVKLLLDKGANPAINCRGLQGVIGITPLMLAADLGHKDIVEILIAHGADVNAQASNSNTALVGTINKGHKEIVALLLKHKAEVTVQMKSTCSMNNRHEVNLILDLYLNKEIQPYIVDPQAYAYRQRELLLEKHKYSRDCKVLTGYTYVFSLLNRSLGHMKCTHQTVLMWASICGHKEAVEELLKADLPLWYLNAQDKNGRTALMYALIYGHTDIAPLLIQAYEAKSKQAYEALEKEVHTEKKEHLKQELEKVKRAINIKDAQGNSAFSYVLEKGADTLALRFLQAGAQPSLKEIKKIADENKKDLLLELIVKGFISPCCDQ